MSKQLIVNADDYGRTAGVTRGIIQAHLEGIVTSTTVMMNMAQVEDALGLARDCPDLGIGVHLVFTAWRPVLLPAEVPSLVDADGHFHSQEAIMSNPNRIDTDELKAELRTQIEHLRALGREPDPPGLPPLRPHLPILLRHLCRAKKTCSASWRDWPKASVS